MKTLRVFVFSGLGGAWLFTTAGCGPQSHSKVTELQRKEAAHHASEAQFALTLRDYARAEVSLAKAAALAPDDGRLWVNLGAARVRLGNRDGAKQAYQSALKAYEADAKDEKFKTDPDPWLRQAYVLALLGRSADAQKVVNKAAEKFPGHRAVKRFIEDKELERLASDPAFKEMAL